MHQQRTFQSFSKFTPASNYGRPNKLRSLYFAYILLFFLSCVYFDDMAALQTLSYIVAACWAHDITTTHRQVSKKARKQCHMRAFEGHSFSTAAEHAIAWAVSLHLESSPFVENTCQIYIPQHEKPKNITLSQTEFPFWYHKSSNIEQPEETSHTHLENRKVFTCRLGSTTGHSQSGCWVPPRILWCWSKYRPENLSRPLAYGVTDAYLGSVMKLVVCLDGRLACGASCSRCKSGTGGKQNILSELLRFLTSRHRIWTVP